MSKRVDKYYTIVMRHGWNGPMQIMAVTSESERMLHGSSEFGGHATRVNKDLAFGMYKSVEAAGDARDDAAAVRDKYVKAWNEAKSRVSAINAEAKKAVQHKLKGDTDG